MPAVATLAAALPAFLVAAVGVLGLAIGSFLNVVVYRVPAGRSVVAPPSACPECHSEIRPRDNVPVLSWLVLRGCCRDCGAPISARYPLVELFTGLAFAAIAAWVAFGATLPGGQVGDAGVGTPASTTAGLAHSLLDLAIMLVLAGVSIALALIDLDTKRLPNVIVAWAAILLGGLVVAASLVAGDPAAIGRALLGGVGLFTLYLVLAIVSRGGLGLGDVKLAGVLGLVLAYFGWAELAVGAFAAFLLGGLAGLVLLVTRRAGQRTAIPFGPWMLLGAWVGIVVGEPVATWYLALAGFG
ncbi:leader peptidase (prepilin peptidase)/N-methyltransferase [Agromyces terreus]|uniref:Leader peptidase (Prepilin peptidase)/N-methyltransferase n=1 Tax=Agromyces terreus TaxID=424795 RepID=A0A9X2H1W7_9MICO|nr:A24 family peptidase [Agromyces terreus]MCP2371088.1 leader peptidase (prepilin peptidase)/N-methyltransferase [Agromyces terreus]